MNSAANLCSALLVAAVLTLACGADQPAPTKVSSPPAREGVAAVAKEGAPKIAADGAVHDFGAIKITDTVEHVFTIRNAGDADLKIDRVKKT